MASNASKSRPLIGVTTYLQRASWGDWDGEAALLPATYLRAVEAAGGYPVMLPPLGTEVSVLDVLDGLIVAGGTDVDPATYGHGRHELTQPQPERDTHDLALTSAALARGLPLFAICRGAQILNVAGGGTLHQHIPDILPGSDYRVAPGVFTDVEFSTTPGSRAAAILGDRAAAPAYHHQSIAELAPGLTVSARAADGTIEAVETTDTSWVLGVQFHPEQNPADARLFEAFVEAAALHHSRRVPSVERNHP